MVDMLKLWSGLRMIRASIPSPCLFYLSHSYLAYSALGSELFFPHGAMWVNYISDWPAGGPFAILGMSRPTFTSSVGHHLPL